jgi:hypothetical protein
MGVAQVLLAFRRDATHVFSHNRHISQSLGCSLGSAHLNVGSSIGCLSQEVGGSRGRESIPRRPWSALEPPRTMALIWLAPLVAGHDGGEDAPVGAPSLTRPAPTRLHTLQETKPIRSVSFSNSTSPLKSNRLMMYLGVFGPNHADMMLLPLPRLPLSDQAPSSFFRSGSK